MSPAADNLPERNWPKPNWDLWFEKGEANASEAVDLTLNCDPNPPDGTVGLEIRPSRELMKIWNIRYVVTKKWLYDQYPELSRLYPPPDRYRIPLPDLAQLAHDHDWDIPVQLADLLPRTSRRAQKKSHAQVGSTEMDMIEKVRWHWWSTYEPGQRASTNEEVAAWITQEFEGISKSKAQAIARLVRPENAPTGRPRKSESKKG